MAKVQYPKHTYEVTMPNGIVHTRTSKNDYRYVVAIQGYGKYSGWSITLWTSRMDLAQKQLNRHLPFCGDAEHHPLQDARIIPVNNPRENKESV